MEHIRIPKDCGKCGCSFKGQRTVTAIFRRMDGDNFEGVYLCGSCLFTEMVEPVHRILRVHNN